MPAPCGVPLSVSHHSPLSRIPAYPANRPRRVSPMLLRRCWSVVTQYGDSQRGQSALFSNAWKTRGRAFGAPNRIGIERGVMLD